MRRAVKSATKAELAVMRENYRSLVIIICAALFWWAKIIETLYYMAHIVDIEADLTPLQILQYRRIRNTRLKILFSVRSSDPFSNFS